MKRPSAGAENSTQGRNLPHRVVVRSAIMPMMMSVMPSESLTISSSTPTANAGMPNVSV
jgi:hypothetical protein